MNHTKLNIVLTREVLFEKYNECLNCVVLTNFDTWSYEIDLHSVSEAIENLKLRNKNSNNQLFGEIITEYDNGNLQEEVSLSNVSHSIKNIFLKGNKIYGNVTALNTPCGNVINELIKNKFDMKFRIRATGFIDNNIKQIIDIITWDIIN